MGKAEDESVKDISDDSGASNEKKPTEIKENKKEEEVVKKDPNELRKVIKFSDQEKSSDNKKTEEKKLDPKQNESIEIDFESTSREALEQKRAILQSIKDFDFQIKKNQEEITSINQKLDSVTKDLDDLVSLYEIVSEQMNPFVGLSKVTKKRLDALENFTKEIEELKNRMGDIESLAEKSGINFEEIKAKGLLNAPSIVDYDFSDLSNDDLDIIIEKSFNGINVEQKIDEVIEQFINGLKK
jgi:flagellar protein FlaC